MRKPSIHMKKLLFVLCCLISAAAQGQPYIVFSVKGEVLADGQVVRIKSTITDDTQLVFKSPDAELHVISPQKGRLVISASRAQKTSTNEFLSAVRNAILPPTQFQTTSTRDTASGPIFEDIYDMKAFFRNRVLVIDTTEYRIDAEELVQDDTHYFEIRYEWEGQAYTRELVSKGELLCLNAFDICGAEADYMGEERLVQLFYSLRPSGRGEKISSFTLVPVSSEVLAAELQTLYDGMQIAPAPFLYEEVLPFLELRYGRPHVRQVKRLLELQLGLKF